MAAYYIGTYDIVDPNDFQKYPPVVMSLLPKYGGEVLASDTSALLVEGTARTMNAIIRFPSKEPHSVSTTIPPIKTPNASVRRPRRTSAWCWWTNSLRADRLRAHLGGALKAYLRTDGTCYHSATTKPDINRSQARSAHQSVSSSQQVR